MKFKPIILIFIGLVTFLLLTSCSPWVVFNQGTNNQWMTLNSANTIGQTFVADYSGLQELYILLAPQSPGDGILTFHLRSDPDSTDDLAIVKLPIKEISLSRSYRFDFHDISESADQYYYAFMSYDGDGSVKVGFGPAEAYDNGAAYQNHLPIESQLTFSTGYDRVLLIIGIFQQLLQWVLFCIVGFLLLTIPGWAVLNVFWRGWSDISGFIKAPLSIGVSMALYTLFVLFTYLLHMQFGRWYAWLPVILGGLIILWRNKNNIGKLISRITHPRIVINLWMENKSLLWSNISLITVLVLIIFSRFWALHGLDEPMWNDSLHHTEITQLFIDHQGLFASWLPYTPYQTFSMHFGFPLAAALLKWITGITSGQAVLYMGQILNIFAPLALYPLAVRLTHGNRFGGVIAVLAAGLISPMPAYYINWGRYAQLAGQVMLPISMWMMWEVLDSTSRDHASQGWLHLPWAKMIITSGVIAGMILFEFRMIFVILTFVISISIGQLITYSRTNILKWLRELWSILLIGLMCIILFLPWGLRVQQSNLINYINFNVKVGSLIDLVSKDYQTWQNINFYVPTGMMFLGFLGWLWAIIKKDWAVTSLGLWMVAMAILYSLVLLHIPWVQYVQSFAVIISLYIPIGLLLSFLAADLTSWLLRWKIGGLAVFSITIFFSLLGAWNQRNISNPGTYSLVTHPDTRAMLWINETTPVNARFLIEGAHENWVTNVIGTDAGWWIPLLAQRENTIPPQYALSNEVPIETDYSLKVVTLEAKLEKTSLATESGIKLLCEYGITHVYIGQKQGSVGDLAKPLFTPNELATNPVFNLIYHQDRVYIYAVEGACDH